MKGILRNVAEGEGKAFLDYVLDIIEKYHNNEIPYSDQDPTFFSS